MTMEQDYQLVLCYTQKGYVVNSRMYCANTMGINTFKVNVSMLEGLFVDKSDLDKMKSYLKKLADSINKRYSDCSLELTFHEKWHGDNCSGFEVHSSYCYRPVCDIYFIGINSKACFCRMPKNTRI